MLLERVERQNRRLLLDLLLLADESEAAVNEYIDEGEMYTIHLDEETIGVVLFTFPANQIVELKNFAIAERYRGKGWGKRVVQKAFELYQSRGFSKMIVGTANSSIANLAFYQKAGFRMTEIKKGFFEKYPTPICENRIRALDMVMFERYFN